MEKKMDMNIKRRLELLDALEAGGVCKWARYDFVIDEYRKRIEQEDKLDDFINNILKIFCENIDQPAGTRCGYGMTKKGQDAVAEFIKSTETFLKLCL